MVASPHARSGGTPPTDSQRGTRVGGVGAELPSGKAAMGLPWGRRLLRGACWAARGPDRRYRPCSSSCGNEDASSHAPHPCPVAFTRPLFSQSASEATTALRPWEHRCVETRPPQRDPDTAPPPGEAGVGRVHKWAAAQHGLPKHRVAVRAASVARSLGGRRQATSVRPRVQSGEEVSPRRPCLRPGTCDGRCVRAGVAATSGTWGESASLTLCPSGKYGGQPLRSPARPSWELAEEAAAFP